MFRSKKNKVPSLSSKLQHSDTGTVRKGGKKYFDTDEHINAPIPKEDVSRKSASLVANANKGTTNKDEGSPSHNTIEPNINLSRDELLKLLSVFEGELQARDEVIAILKSECAQNTDTRYGLTSQPLKALQRDSATLEMTSEDDVYEHTKKDQLKNIIQQQKEQYRKLQHMHLASVDKYRRLSVDTEEEKQKHQEYIMKSDDFVNLLEHDRERLRQLIEEEKATRDVKEKELTRKLKENKEEVVRLKSLSLELVEERHQQLQALDEEKQLTTALRRQIEDLQAKVKEAETTAATEKEHAVQLENELEEQTNKSYKEYEALKEKLTAEEAKAKQKEEKIKSLGRQIKKLKCVDKNLRKTDDQLWRIKEKLEQEERHEDLLEEVELLRKTVAGMQEAEKIYTQAQEESNDLKETLQHELARTGALRAEVETLRQSVRNRIDAERCIEEAMFRLDEVQQLFEAERKKVDKMKKQSEEFRARLTKIDESEKMLQLSEAKLKQVRMLAEERKEAQKALETKLQLEQDKTSHYEEIIEDERAKVTEVTQKTIEESKKVLKLKENLAALETKRIEKTEVLHRKLESAEESIRQMISKEKADQMDSLINNLRKQVEMLKKRLDQLENETEKKGNEARIAKEEAEIAKQNLNTSTEKLKRLVAFGLNEQMAIAQCEELKQKQSTLEITNASLREEVKSLESKLQQTTVVQANKNNNNTVMKPSSVSTWASQSLNLEQRSRVSPRNRRQQPLTSSTDSEDSRPAILRTSKSPKQDLFFDGSTSNETSSAPSNGVVDLSSRQSAAYLTERTARSPWLEAKHTRPLSSRLKSREESKSKSHSPISTKAEHDLSNEMKPSDNKTLNNELNATKAANGKEPIIKSKKSEDAALQRRTMSAPHETGRAPRLWLSGKVSSKITEIHANSLRRNIERNSSALRTSSNVTSNRTVQNSPRTSRELSSSATQR